MAQEQSTVVGVFANVSAAQLAVRQLREANFREDQIGVIARDSAGATGTTEEGSKWEEGAIAGGLAGAGIGGVWALGIAAGMLPAIGPVIAGGLLASVLASAAGGAAVGGLVGALLGMGISEEEARHYDREFQLGRTLVTVKAEDRANEAADILRRTGGGVRRGTATPGFGRGAPEPVASPGYRG